MFCWKCGKEHFEESTLCKECSSKVGQSVLENGFRTNVNNKGMKFTMSNRNMFIVIGIVIALIGGYLFYNNYKSNNVSKKVIKSDLVGQTIQVGNLSEFDITEDMKKNISIDRKKVEMDYGVKTYIANGTIKVENDNYELEVPFESSYIYNNLSKDWKLVYSNVENSDKGIKLNIKKELTDEVILSQLTGKINKKDSSADNEKSKIKVKKKEKNDDAGTGFRIEGSLDYEGTLVSKTENFSTVIVFDGEDWGINGNVNTNDSKVEISNDVSSASSEQILDDIKVLFINKTISLDSSSSWNSTEINASQISEISDVNVEKNNTTKVTGKVKVKSECLEADGDFELQLGSYGYISATIECEDSSLTAPSEDTIKSLLKKQNVYIKVNDNSKNVTLKEDDIKTFKLGETFQSKNSFRAMYIYGTLSYDELNDDEICIMVLYNPKENKWNVSDVVSKSVEYNKNYFDKEKLNK